MTPDFILITLKKAAALKWRGLEKSKHDVSLSLSSSSVAISNQTSTNQNGVAVSSPGNSGDPAPVDDVIATPTSPAESSRETTETTEEDSRQNRVTSHSSPTEPPKQQNSREPDRKFHTNPLYNPPPSNSATESSNETTYVAPAEREMLDPSFREKQLGQPCTTGLMNLGNSCFMNSVLQCLSNTPELRDYFVKGHYLVNINTQNPLGFQGRLAKCFCTILRKLWSGEYEYFSPRKLLEIVAKRSKYFGGNSQHDTHEFMSYLIDGLHEDLNRVREKPVTQPVELEGHPDRYDYYY